MERQDVRFRSMVLGMVLAIRLAKIIGVDRDWALRIVGWLWDQPESAPHALMTAPAHRVIDRT